MGTSRYRHIIWDWNGTLLDDVALSIDIMNGLLRQRGLPLLDRERYHRVFDFPVKTYYERVGFDFARDSFEQLSIDFISAYDARRWECALHVGAEELVRTTAAAGISQSILSAYRQETLEEIVAHFGLTSLFVRRLGLDNIYAHSKTELGRAWVRELGVPGQEILLIGDTLHDHAVAQELGVDCVLVAQGHHSAARLRNATERVLPDLAAVRDFLGLPPIIPAAGPVAVSDSKNLGE